MIVPDVNLLLYAHVAVFAEHAEARAWWEDLMNGERGVGIPAPSIFGFVRIATNPRVFAQPMSVEDAIGVVRRWLDRLHVRLLLPGSDHLQIAFALLSRAGTAGNLTTDAQLAALAIEHRGELHSNDSDFSRFDELRWVDPIRRGKSKRRR